MNVGVAGTASRPRAMFDVFRKVSRRVGVGKAVAFENRSVEKQKKSRHAFCFPAPSVALEKVTGCLSLALGGVSGSDGGERLVASLYKLLFPFRRSCFYNLYLNIYISFDFPPSRVFLSLILCLSIARVIPPQRSQNVWFWWCCSGVYFMGARGGGLGAVAKVCCAWDMYITMYGSDDVIADKVAIPTVYVTMADGKMLQYAGEVDVQVREKSHPAANDLAGSFVAKERIQLSISGFGLVR